MNGQILYFSVFASFHPSLINMVANAGDSSVINLSYLGGHFVSEFNRFYISSDEMFCPIGK